MYAIITQPIALISVAACLASGRLPSAQPSESLHNSDELRNSSVNKDRQMNFRNLYFVHIDINKQQTVVPQRISSQLLFVAWRHLVGNH